MTTRNKARYIMDAQQGNDAIVPVAGMVGDIKTAAVTDAPSVTEFRRLLAERGVISDKHSLAQQVLLAHRSVVLSFCDGDTFACVTATPDATFKQALTAQSVCAHTDCAHRGCCDHSRIVRSIASS